jgi:molybdopterin molybdotransferase
MPQRQGIAEHRAPPPGERLTIAEARTRLLSDARPSCIDRVSLADAHGAVLAAPALAERSSPPWNCSAVDGIAVESDGDIRAGTRWRLSGTILAGAPAADAPSSGALSIMTGAQVPCRCSTVLPIEALEFDQANGDAILIRPIRHGSNIRCTGEDVVAREVVVDAGVVITSFHVAALAAANVKTVDVVRRPTVQVVVTGAEVVPSGPGSHQIVDALGPMLNRLVVSAGGDPQPVIYVGDDERALSDVMLDASSQTEVVITTGGAGPGVRDLILATAGRHGDAQQWHLAVKPGKPFVYGRIGRTAVLGLPGNPGAAIASFVLLVDPLIRRLAGCQDLDPRLVDAVAAADLTRVADGRLHALRGRVSVTTSGQLVVSVPSGQGSHQLRDAANANAIVLLQDGNGVRAGDPLRAVLLDELVRSSVPASPTHTPPHTLEMRLHNRIGTDEQHA